MGGSGAVLGAFFEDFKRWAGKRKELRNLHVFYDFSHFWEARKRCLSILGAVLAVSEASGGLSWTISEHFWTCWREHGEQEGQDGDQEGQYGDQERQDEPT